jgi:hypothetical protein
MPWQDLPNYIRIAVFYLTTTHLPEPAFYIPENKALPGPSRLLFGTVLSGIAIWGSFQGI